MSVFHNWLLEIACENYFVYIKRLSANDTGATGGHQVGLYIPSGIVEKLFPSINHTRELNPSVFLTAHVSSHDCPDSEARAIYYNSRHFGKTRNEKRITRWGRGSPLQDPENTGALTLLAFKLDEQGGDCKEVNIWVCASTDEEDVIETAIGEVIPGALISGPAGQILGGLSLQQAPVNHKYILPEDWHLRFPSGSEIIQYAASHYVKNSLIRMSNFLTAGAWSTTYFYWLRNCMFWISSGKDLALWMNLLRWPILSAIAVNPEPGSRWNCTWSIYSLSTACDTLRRRPSQKVIKNPISFSLPQGLTTILSFP